MATAGAETNVQLIVAGVFAATFLVVGVLAYLILFRQSPAEAETSGSRPSAGDPGEAAAASARVASEPSAQFTLPLDAPPSKPPDETVWESESVSVGSRPPDAAEQERPDRSQQLLLRLYRALMFVTGIAGLLASALMFSAVEGFTVLPVAALLVAAFGVYSIYRGFVPDDELRRRR